jgi:hypothetical protein
MDDYVPKASEMSRALRDSVALRSREYVAKARSRSQAEANATAAPVLFVASGRGPCFFNSRPHVRLGGAKLKAGGGLPDHPCYRSRQHVSCLEITSDNESYVTCATV